ncbi:MAG: SPASM domain-containing protein [Oligoflexia bacterium]|nr:SPASM domain-containing protein [Oligoflexia bacterium]
MPTNTLKRSMYNIIVDQLSEGEVLLFNSSSCAFGVMDKKAQMLYDKIDEITDISTLDEEDQKNLNVLAQNGFFVPHDTDEFKLLNIIGNVKRHSTSGLNITLAPTTDCNMACPYCYEKNTKRRMGPEIIAAVVNFIKSYCENNRPTTVTLIWYGGEPLLELDTIQTVSEQVVQLCQEKNIDYNSSIVTNGVLLTRETAIILKEKCKITSAQITVDGLESVHNRRRILRSGADSFNSIINNIENIKDVIEVTIRVNVDKKNIEETGKLIHYFSHEKGWRDDVIFYFAPVDGNINSCVLKENTCYSRPEFGKIHAELMRKSYESGNVKIISKLYPRKSELFCGAITLNTVVVDPDGYLYTCWNDVGLPEKKIGDVSTGMVMGKNYIDWLSIDYPDKCKLCNLLPICASGCPYHRLRNGNTAECIYQTLSFKENLKITYEEYLTSSPAND